MPDDDWWHELWCDPLAIVEDIGINSHHRVLDLCCGNGWFTQAIAKQLIDSSNVMALDIDEQLIDQAKIRCADYDVQFVVDDAMNVAKSVQSPVDYILIANTFHGIPDKEELLKRLLPLLADDSEVCIINWYPSPDKDTCVLGVPRGPAENYRLSPSEVSEYMRKVGFSFLSEQKVSDFHYALRYKKCKK